MSRTLRASLDQIAPNLTADQKGRILDERPLRQAVELTATWGPQGIHRRGVREIKGEERCSRCRAINIPCYTRAGTEASSRAKRCLSCRSGSCDHARFKPAQDGARLDPATDPTPEPQPFTAVPTTSEKTSGQQNRQTISDLSDQMADWEATLGVLSRFAEGQASQEISAVAAEIRRARKGKPLKRNRGRSSLSSDSDWNDT